MPDALIRWLRQCLPQDLVDLTEPYIEKLDSGEYYALLSGEDAQKLFGRVETDERQAVSHKDFPAWNDYLFYRLGVLLSDRRRPEKQGIYFCIGYAALLAFLQASFTGPPLPFDPATTLLPHDVAHDQASRQNLHKTLLESLGMDGISAYALTPNMELLCLADVIFTCPPIIKNIKAARWAKLRLGFVHQRLLSEISSSLQDVIYDDLGMLRDALFGETTSQIDDDLRAEFLLERATINNYHGFDKAARIDLDEAARLRHFEYAVIGRLGKRTKFQQNDISQLVVLARSTESEDTKAEDHSLPQNGTQKPTALDLNDDTLLESISFAQRDAIGTHVADEASLPKTLASLDPAQQPQLHPLDSAVLLVLASSITNTSPEDGLTREETLPYATRVIEGGSSNWQIYTQALLVRSRIEGYHSRTVERGLLQLQALVDQVIADTSAITPGDGTRENVATTSFLPKAEQSESAPAQDRLRYIFQLASPSRWDLEAELASRWVQLGGLRSALEIYGRLELWAELALCWAATEREDKAKQIIRKRIFHAADGKDDNEATEDEQWTGEARDPPPSDAPRLYCILGDIDQDRTMYEKAWEISGKRYARAQRSLGRLRFAAKDYAGAAEAYSLSLKANQVNQSSWFALGCARLELEQYDEAVAAFSRCVQLDETDAESWSNLAAALLRAEPKQQDRNDVANLDVAEQRQKNRQDALKALNRAATLKHDSYRIWENVLTVSASLSPPAYESILAALKRIIALRGPIEGEKCIDIDILDGMVQHIIATGDSYDPEKPGLARMLVKFIDQDVTPIITGSPDLWRLFSRLALWRNKPSSALDAEEKAWRAVTAQPGWESESEKRWNAVVEATVRLCDSYESLGPRERSEGLAAGEFVAKDWKFKARTAVRGILGRGKASWEGTSGWDRLRSVLDDLRA